MGSWGVLDPRSRPLTSAAAAGALVAAILATFPAACTTGPGTSSAPATRRGGVTARPDTGAFCAALAAHVTVATTSDEVVVFVEPDASPDAVDAVFAAISERPGVASITYVDKAETLAEFRGLFADAPDLVAGAGPELLPTSFRVQTSDPAALDTLTRIRGVKEVVRSRPEDLPSIGSLILRFWSSRVADVVVFFEPEVELADAEVVRAEIASMRGVRSARVVDREEAYRRIATEDGLAEHLTPEMLPIAVEAVVDDLDARDAIKDAIDARRGVRYISSSEEVVRVVAIAASIISGATTAVEEIVATAPDQIATDVERLVDALPSAAELEAATRLVGSDPGARFSLDEWAALTAAATRVESFAHDRCPGEADPPATR